MWVADSLIMMPKDTHPVGSLYDHVAIKIVRRIMFLFYNEQCRCHSSELVDIFQSIIKLKSFDLFGLKMVTLTILINTILLLW